MGMHAIRYKYGYMYILLFTGTRCMVEVFERIGILDTVMITYRYVNVVFVLVKER